MPARTAFSQELQRRKFGAAPKYVEEPMKLEDVNPTPNDFQAAIQARPEMVYFCVAQQELTVMEERMKHRGEELEEQIDSYNQIMDMDHAQLNEQRRNYADCDKQLNDFRWKRDKIRADIRDHMHGEAEAAHVTDGALKRRNTALLEIEKKKIESKTLEVELAALEEQQRANRAKYADEKMTIIDKYRDEALAIDNQAVDARAKAKELKAEAQKLESLAGVRRHETIAEEEWFKATHLEVAAHKREIDGQVEQINANTKTVAQQNKEAYHIIQERFGEAIEHIQ